MGIAAAEHRRRRRELKAARRLVRNVELAAHVGSVALAVEALERVLVRKGVLADGDLLRELEVVSQEKWAAGEGMPAADD